MSSIHFSDKDIVITLFSGTGAGGQNRNKCQKCIRIKHIPTGIIVTGQSQRSLEANKRDAFNELDRRLAALNHVDKERLATKVPVHVVARRIADKRMNSIRKESRNNRWE